MPLVVVDVRLFPTERVSVSQKEQLSSEKVESKKSEWFIRLAFKTGSWETVIFIIVSKLFHDFENRSRSKIVMGA